MSIKPNPFPPKSLTDFVISDASSRQEIENIVNGNIPFPVFKEAICLWGAYGTGKTTLAKMLPPMLEASGNMPKSSNGLNPFQSLDYYHITSCGHGSNSVNLVQEMAKRSSSVVDLSPKGYFYEILDEVDMMTQAAQASLKSYISEAKDTVFIITTNHPDKLNAGLKDRSYMIEMNQPSPVEMEQTGRRFLRDMGLTGNEVSSEILQQIAAASRGSMREFGGAIITIGLRYGGTVKI